MLSSHVRKRKIIYNSCCGFQTWLMWHYIPLILLQCIIFMPKHNDSFSFHTSSKFCYLQLKEDNSCFYKMIKSWIMAAYYLEITSPIYEKNQHFESFKMVHNLKFCPIPFNAKHIISSAIRIFSGKNQWFCINRQKFSINIVIVSFKKKFLWLLSETGWVY